MQRARNNYWIRGLLLAANLRGSSTCHPPGSLKRWYAKIHEELTEVKFGSKLKSIGKQEAFIYFYHESLERITIPLKDGLVDDDDTVHLHLDSECAKEKISFVAVK